MTPLRAIVTLGLHLLSLGMWVVARGSFASAWPFMALGLALSASLGLLTVLGARWAAEVPKHTLLPRGMWLWGAQFGGIGAALFGMCARLPVAVPVWLAWLGAMVLAAMVAALSVQLDFAPLAFANRLRGMEPQSEGFEQAYEVLLQQIRQRSAEGWPIARRVAINQGLRGAAACLFLGRFEKAARLLEPLPLERAHPFQRANVLLTQFVARIYLEDLPGARHCLAQARPLVATTPAKGLMPLNEALLLVKEGKPAEALTLLPQTQLPHLTKAGGKAFRHAYHLVECEALAAQGDTDAFWDALGKYVDSKHDGNLRRILWLNGAAKKLIAAHTSKAADVGFSC